MSISGIQGATSAGYSNPYSKRGSSTAEHIYSNPALGSDRVSFSEDALKMAQALTAKVADAQEEGGVCKDKLLSDEAQSAEARNAEAPSSSLTELSKASLFSMLLESLFLAELEDSAADSADAAHGATEQGNEGDVQRQQRRDTKSASSLEGGERVAEIKKILADFTKGKIDLSELPQAMAGSAARGTGKVASAATQREGQTAANSGVEERSV